MFLSDQEIAEMCAPLVSLAAQRRYLRSLGLVVNEKPNGRPLVVRSHAEAVLSGRAEVAAAEAPAPTSVPDRDALIKVIRERKAAQAKRTGRKASNDGRS